MDRPDPKVYWLDHGFRPGALTKLGVSGKTRYLPALEDCSCQSSLHLEGQRESVVLFHRTLQTTSIWWGRIAGSSSEPVCLTIPDVIVAVRPDVWGKKRSSSVQLCRDMGNHVSPQLSALRNRQGQFLLPWECNECRYSLFTG